MIRSVSNLPTTVVVATSGLSDGDPIIRFPSAISITEAIGLLNRGTLNRTLVQPVVTVLRGVVGHLALKTAHWDVWHGFGGGHTPGS